MADPWAAIDDDTTREPLPMAQDPNQSWVYCSREVWRHHILEHHPEIEVLKDLIVSAIQSPQEQDTDPEDRRVIRYYVNVPEERFRSSRSLLLRVVVKYVYPTEQNSRRTGLLSSAYLLTRE